MRWAAAAALATLGLALAAGAGQRADAAATPVLSQPQLSAILLGDRDLPADYRPYTPLTGPVNADRLRFAHVDPGQLPRFGEGGFVPTWTGPAGQVVLAMVFDSGKKSSAEGWVHGIVTAGREDGYKKFAIPSVPRATGLTRVRRISSIDEVFWLAAFSRGPLVYEIRVSVPAVFSIANAYLISDLAGKQWAAAPPDATENAPGNDELAGRAIGAVVFGLIIYIAWQSGFAYLRDPLKRRHNPSKRSAASQARGAVIDVSTAARRRRNRTT